MKDDIDHYKKNTKCVTVQNTTQHTEDKFYMYVQTQNLRHRLQLKTPQTLYLVVQSVGQVGGDAESCEILRFYKIDPPFRV